MSERPLDTRDVLVARFSLHFRARKRAVLAAALAGALAPSVASPVDEVFRVNAYTTGFQHSPSAQREAGGGYLVTWSDGSGYAERARRRRLALNGHPIGSELAVGAADALASMGGIATRAANDFQLPDQGQFVVASWVEEYGNHCGPPSGPTSTTTYCGDFYRDSWITIQRFASAGQPIGTEIIRQRPYNENRYPDAAAQAAFDAVFGPVVAEFPNVTIPVMNHMAMLDSRTSGTNALEDHLALPASAMTSLYLGTGRHNTLNDDATFRDQLREDWFDFHLKGEANGIDTAGPVRMAFW